MDQPTDAFMDACRRWADDTGQPAYAAAYFVFLFLGGQYERRGATPDPAQAHSRDQSAQAATDDGGHHALDQVRDRIEKLIEFGVREEWLIASLATAIGDSLDDASDAARGQARRKRVGAAIHALQADADRREASIAEAHMKLTDDGEDATRTEAEASFERWVASSSEVLQPMSFEEWMDRLWLARRWRELAHSLTSVSALFDRRSPFNLP